MTGFLAELAFAGVFGGILFGAIGINYCMERWHIRARWPEEGQKAEPLRSAGRKRPGRWFTTPAWRTLARTQERSPVGGTPTFEPGPMACESIALNRAFAAIADPKLRADVVAHVEGVARTDRHRTKERTGERKGMREPAR